jgi:phosphatidylglycerophosphate synthase
VTNTSYLWRAGEALDQFLNVVLFDGDVGETISYHAASKVAPPRRKRWACFLCVWLSMTVEKAHCIKTLHGVSISERGGLKAGVQLLALFLLLTGIFWFIILHH